MNIKQNFPWSRLLCLLLAVAVTGCTVLPGGASKPLDSNASRIANPQVADADIQSLSGGNTEFALDFYRHVRTGPGNQFFSPYSLSVALAMTYAGARGATAEQMAGTLHFNLPGEKLHPAFNALDLQLTSSAAAPSGNDSQPFQLSTANSLWGQQDYEFQAEFLDLLALHYGAGMRLTDFRRDPEDARRKINTWIEQETQERIQDMIPSGGISSDARLVLANAIYFKADWIFPFEAANTRPQTFYRLDGSQIETPMMAFASPETLAYYEEDGLQAVELPYRGGGMSMLVLLPAEGRFEDFEAGLDVATLAQVVSGLQPATVSLSLPKFEFSADYTLAETLAGMGMPDAFCTGDADFSGMDGTRTLCIGQVFHKAFVAVDEKGTEAAAATVVMMEAMAALNEDLKVMQVDRPFIFAIRHDPSGSILFLGRVLDPAK